MLPFYLYSLYFGMKTDHLLFLLQQLSKNEKHSFLLELGNKKDKRYKMLHQTVRMPANVESLLKIRNKFFEKGKKGDKDYSRFKDFAKKQIEKFLVISESMNNEALKNYLLLNRFQSRNAKMVSYYLDKIKKSNNGTVDHIFFESKSLEIEFSILAQSQNKKNLEKLIVNARNKFSSVREVYHQQSAKLHELVSGLLVDDQYALEKMQYDLTAFQDLNALINQCEDPARKIDYKISNAMYQFYDRDKLYASLKEIDRQLFQLLPEQEEITLVQRRYFLARLTSGFHYGETPDKLISYSSVLRDLSAKLNFAGTVTFFYHCFFLILNKQDDEALKLLDSEAEAYFPGKSNPMRSFLDALIHLNNENLYKAFDTFNDVSYENLYYIEMWSRLTAAAIQIKLGNIKLAENLLDRIRKKLKKYTYRTYTLNSNYFLLDSLLKITQNPSHKPNNIKAQCYLHQYVLKSLYL